MNIPNPKPLCLTLTLLTESQLSNLPKASVFTPEPVRDPISIDFTQMLQREWSVQPDEIIFNSKNKLEIERSRKIIKTVVNFNAEAENGGLVVGRERGRDRAKGGKDRVRLPEVEIVGQGMGSGEDVDEFLGSFWFQICTRFFVLLYILGLLLADYSYRLQPHSSQPLSSSNKVSLNLQLLSNCAFTLEILLKMFSKQKYFDNAWNILTLVGCLACWSCIFLDFEKYDRSPLFHVLSMRIIEIFEFIKNPFESFIMTIPELSKIFFPYLIFISMYAVLGLILFSGANEHKCRQTPQPVNSSWPEVAPNLCGSSFFQCKTGYCGNPHDYGLPYNSTQRYGFGNEFGLVNFDNIGNSFLVVYHYVFMSNWSAIMYKFSKFVNPYMTTFYFVTLALFLFFIMSNLNMITMCKTFIEKEKEKEKFVVKEPEPFPSLHADDDIVSTLPLRHRNLYTVLEYLDLVLLLLSSTVILIEYESMPSSLISLVNKLDFSLTLCCFVVIVLKTVIVKKQIVKDKLLILDWIAILFSIGDIVYCLATGMGEAVLDPPGVASRVLRSLKLVRILRVIYFSTSWFTFEKTILRMFVETLDTVKYFLVLLLCITTILALIGQNLFSHLMLYNHQTHQPDPHGQPYITNFDSLYKALIAVTLLLENERWSQTMYNFYNVVGWGAVAYFVVVVFIVHLLLTRLFLAIFLCYFRRDLERKDEAEGLGHNKGKADGVCRCDNQSDGNAPIVQFLEKQSEKPSCKEEPEQPQREQEEKIFWLFRRSLYPFQLLRGVYNSQAFHRILLSLLLLHSLTLLLRTNTDSQTKTHILNILQYIPLYFYVLEVVIGVVGFGLYWGNKTYLKEGKINFVNLAVAVLVLVSETGLLGDLEAGIVRRFAVLKILTVFTRANKETSIVLDSISAISQRFCRMIVIYMFLLILSSLLPLKLQKSALASCHNASNPHSSTPLSPQECMLLGGDWVRDAQGFTNIFESVLLMYQVVTAQSWLYFIEMFDQGQPWDLFFVVNFFVYNLCLLNIFVGLTVETYLALKDQAYKLNLLRPNQRMWLLIRNSINQLIPTPMMAQPETSSKFRKLAYFIISQPLYQNFMDILPYINIVLYTLHYYRAQSSYLAKLGLLQNLILLLFMLDTTLKLQLHWNYFYLDNCKIELAGFVYHIGYFIVFLAGAQGHELDHVLRFCSALLLILRGKRLLFRFTWSKTLLNSVIEVLPKCVTIGALLAVILFFYISVGMEVFKHTKPTPKSDGYVTGFNNAFTSLITLLKIVSNEAWFDQVAAFVRGSSPIDICYPILTAADAIAHPSMGCGSKAAYLYFISFHMIIALLVMNLLIATMVAAYDENYEKEYKSVNIFQLQDCLKLWQKYDPNGTGVIPYKKFWRLSSEIAILFGISKKKLIKGKQKFLEELDIEVCQSMDPKSTSVLCYKFHDVLTKFSKIKLTVSKTEYDQNNEYMDFQIHPMIEHEIKDYITKIPPLYENIRPYKNFKSGEMKYFFGLLRKMRAWKIVAKKRDSSVISKLSHIINVALEKKQKEEKEISHIRSSMSNFMQNKNE